MKKSTAIIMVLSLLLLLAALYIINKETVPTEEYIKPEATTYHVEEHPEDPDYEIYMELKYGPNWNN